MLQCFLISYNSAKFESGHKIDFLFKNAGIMSTLGVIQRLTQYFLHVKF